MTTQDCKFCNRLGLPLLPLRLAFVPNGLNNAPARIVNGNPALATPLSEGTYMLRVISEGYVYVYDARAGGFFRCFAATPSGHFKEYPVDQRPDAEPSFQCAQNGHATVASLINIERASEAGEVWIGYSRVGWTRHTRALIKKNTALREQLMVKFNAAQVVKGHKLPDTVGVRVDSGAELASFVGEYVEKAADFALIDKRYEATASGPAIKRSGQADDLVQRMQMLSPGNAIVLALPDTVGIVQDVNHWRNVKAGELAKYQGDQAKVRERIVGDLILNLQQSMEKQGQGKEWTKRYAKHVDMGRVKGDRGKFDVALASHERRILAASADWHTWVSSPRFTAAWKVYDGADKVCGLALERDLARCVFGSGTSKKEQKWWDKWLGAAPDDKDHPLWRAFAAGDKSVTDYLLGDAAKPGDMGKTDKGTDLVKNTREFGKEFRAWLKERQHSGQQRAAQAETGLLGQVIASQLIRLVKAKPEQALVVGQRIRIIAASRMEAIVTPHTVQMTVQQLVVQLHETVWGPPTAKLSKTVREARQVKIAQTVGGAWLGGHFRSDKLLTVDVWLPDEVARAASSAKPAAKALPGMDKAGTLALPSPSALNPWQGLVGYIKGLKGAGAGLMGLGAALQISNLSSTLIQLDRASAGNAANRDDTMQEAKYGIVSGVLGVTGLTMEVVAGALKARVMPSLVSTAARPLLMTSAWIGLVGGAFGAVSAAVEGAQLWGKASGLELEGDKDAATSYINASIAIGVAAFASAAISVIGAGSALSAAGATGAAATAIISAGSFLATIPVWGWILLVIGAVGAGIYFAYKGATAEDTPLEKWLSRCCYRNATSKRQVFSDMKSEMAEFQQAIYGLTVTLNWNDRFGKDEIELQVLMPGYRSGHSEYALLLELMGPGGRKTPVYQRASTFSSDRDLQPRPTQHYVSATPQGYKSIPMDQVLELSEPLTLSVENGLAKLAAKVRANEDFYQSARLKFEYWPDAIGAPDLRMIPVPGGANFSEARD